MTSSVSQFPAALRVLHWLMAVLIIAMLFIGVGMVSTVTETRTWLLELHKPLGVLILCLAAIRLIVRLVRPVPPLPADMPGLLKLAAHGSHILLYILMFAQPLVGWAMLSAGGYPISLFGAFTLPPIAPIDPPLFALLRSAHEYLAILLFLTVLAHIAAALFHGWIRRDGVFESMASMRSATHEPPALGQTIER